jgi:FkbM family methyltransferase
MLFDTTDSILEYTGDLPNNSHHQFCKNVYSDNGEDGLLDQLLTELDIKTGTFCEYGAGNGISSSNTRNLIEKRGFTGLYIEGNAYVHSQLVHNTSHFTGIRYRQGMVHHTDEYRDLWLNTYIDDANIPHDLDVLSININSYHVWEKFSYNPKIVIIQTNPYRDPIVTELNGIKQREMNIDILEKIKPCRIAQGTSFLPTIKLGLEKGYVPVAFSGNITFVRKDLTYLLKQFPYIISEDPYDYLYFYDNLAMWGDKWYSCGIITFNTAVRNYYMKFKKYKIDLEWIYIHIENYGQELWKYGDILKKKTMKDYVEDSGLKLDENGKIVIPDDIKHFKIDIGLSFDAPHSQNWLDNDESIYVFGFEPNPVWVKYMTSPDSDRDRTFKDYHTYTKQLQYENVGKRFFVIPVALSDVSEQKEMKLYIPNESDGCGSLLKDRRLGGTIRTHTVSVFSLSDFLELLPMDKIDYIDYVKIDVQGLDLNVLKSAKQFLSEKVVYVTAEPETIAYHGADHNTKANIASYMTGIGFVQVDHPNTTDPTFLNTKFQDKKDTYIWQYY